MKVIAMPPPPPPTFERAEFLCFLSAPFGISQAIGCGVQLYVKISFYYNVEIQVVGNSFHGSRESFGTSFASHGWGARFSWFNVPHMDISTVNISQHFYFDDF